MRTMIRGYRAERLQLEGYSWYKAARFPAMRRSLSMHSPVVAICFDGLVLDWSVFVSAVNIGNTRASTTGEETGRAGLWNAFMLNSLENTHAPSHGPGCRWLRPRSDPWGAWRPNPIVQESSKAHVN